MRARRMLSSSPGPRARLRTAKPRLEELENREQPNDLFSLIGGAVGLQLSALLGEMTSPAPKQSDSAALVAANRAAPEPELTPTETVSLFGDVDRLMPQTLSASRTVSDAGSAPAAQGAAAFNFGQPADVFDLGTLGFLSAGGFGRTANSSGGLSSGLPDAPGGAPEIGPSSTRAAPAPASSAAAPAPGGGEQGEAGGGIVAAPAAPAQTPAPAAANAGRISKGAGGESGGFFTLGAGAGAGQQPSDDDVLLRSMDSYLADATGTPDPSQMNLQASGDGGIPDALAQRDLFFAADNMDPGVPGPLAVTVQEYNFGNTALTFPGFPGPIELVSSIHAPTDLSGGPRPVIVLLHGRHATTFNPVTNQAFLEWPPGPGRLAIPNHRGYDYLANNLASNGYVVVSVSANGVNARDNGVFDLGALARAQVIQRNLEVLRDLSAGNGTVHPFGTAPLGNRYVGKLDLQNIGTMGHSRGGEGVVRHFIFNQQQGSPFGIKAVFALAPVDFNRPVINGVPFANLAPYLDGDVLDLQGVHFYDDARYNAPGDRAPKHSITVLGGNHNFFNTTWTPGLFPAGTSDDGLLYTGDEFGDFNIPGNGRLTAAQERGVGNAYMSAFFRTYLGNESQFLPILKGEAPPPPSALTDQVTVAFQAPSDSRLRRDVNRLTVGNRVGNTLTGNLVTNTLGGAVTTSGLSTYTLAGNVTQGQPAQALPTHIVQRQPHTVPSARSNAPGLSQLIVSWDDPSAFYQNDVPVGSRDLRGYEDLTFRASVNFDDFRNVSFLSDFSVTLTDGDGNSSTRAVSEFSDELFYPPGKLLTLPRILLHTVRVPLAAFSGIDVSNVASLRFNFDREPTGGLILSDVAFSDRNPAAPPFVLNNSPSARRFGPVDRVRLTFSKAIDVSTFTTADVLGFTGPQGAIPVTGVVPVMNSGGTQFDVTFAATGRTGTYTLTVGPNILDLDGQALDEDNDFNPGEALDDRFTATFALNGPSVLGAIPAPTDVAATPFSTFRLSFSTPINPATFTPSDVVSFLRAGGPQIAVSGVTPVANTGNRQFDVSFAAQTVGGTYTVVLGPDVRDVFDNQLDQNGNLITGEVPGDRFSTTFNVVAPFGYVFGAAAFETLNLEAGQPGVFTLIDAADDAAATVNLGANVFSFFGVNFTGNNQLFVSSNGLITFGQANADFNNANLTASPPQRAIAPFWDDLIKFGPTPMVLGRFDGLGDADPNNDRLVIEWNDVSHFDGGNTGATFQAILQLNTGANPGNITFNYVDLLFGDPTLDNGGSATTGVKDLGLQGVNRLLVNFSNGNNPFIRSNQAVRIFRP